jgi:hypothetical protein
MGSRDAEIFRRYSQVTVSNKKAMIRMEKRKLKGANSKTLEDFDSSSSSDEEDISHSHYHLMNSNSTPFNPLRNGFQQPMSTKKVAKRIVDQHVESMQSSFFMNFHYGPIMFLGFDRDEMVLVERPILSVLEKLPPGFFEKRYGQ